MAKGISISIGADTRDFMTAIQKGLIDPTEDAAKVLDKLGYTGADNLEELERAYKQAQEETKKLARENRELGDIIRQEAGESVRAQKRAAKEQVSTARESMREVKGELLQNASETFSSFDGSLNSFVDTAQGTLGGLVVGLSSTGAGIPAAAAVAAGAAGIGLVSAALTDANERQKELEEAASEWAQTYIDSAGRVVNAAQQTAMFQAIATDPERYKEAEKNANLWGVSVSTAINAMTGNTWALEEAQASLNKRHDEFAAVLNDNNQKMLDESTALGGWRGAVQEGQAALDGITGAMQLGAQQADAYSDSLRLLAEHTAGATKQIDEFGDTVYTLPDETKVYIDAETGQATQDVDAIEKRIYSLPTSTTLKLDVDTSEADRKLENWRANQRRLLEVKLQAMDRQGRAIP
ncbi:MAG: hypothetical protein DI534_09755 [Leifsonia xyli]|nr:MAG: hypothetical protein DI534_09755 [Leifsonia xyli]